MRDFMEQGLKRQLVNQEFVELIILANFLYRHGSRPVPTCLSSIDRCSLFANGVTRKLVAKGLASNAFSRRLPGARNAKGI